MNEITPNTFQDLLFALTALWGLIVCFLARLIAEQRKIARELSSRIKTGVSA